VVSFCKRTSLSQKYRKFIRTNGKIKIGVCGKNNIILFTECDISGVHSMANSKIPEYCTNLKSNPDVCTPSQNDAHMREFSVGR
jgi:hypothetical protein